MIELAALSLSAVSVYSSNCEWNHVIIMWIDTSSWALFIGLLCTGMSISVENTGISRSSGYAKCPSTEVEQKHLRWDSSGQMMANQLYCRPLISIFTHFKKMLH